MFPSKRLSMTQDKVCNVSNAFFQFLSTSKLIFCIAVSSTLVVFKKAAFPSTKLEEKSSRINKTKIHIAWKSQKCHIVWKSPKLSHLKITKISHLNFVIFQKFCPIKVDLSGNIFWPQEKRFSKTLQFWHFQSTFVHSKCKRSSLRWQCWMRLFLWFSITVLLVKYLNSKILLKIRILVHFVIIAYCLCTKDKNFLQNFNG